MLGGGPVLPEWVTHAWEADSLSLADGDPVTTWTDSVSGVSVSQTTTAKKPTYRAGGGTPYVDYDGVDDIMSYAGSVFYRKTILVAARYDAYVLYGGLFSEDDSNPSGDDWIQVYSNTSKRITVITNRPTSSSVLQVSSVITYSADPQVFALQSGGRVYVDRVDIGAHPTQMASAGTRSSIGAGYGDLGLDGRIFAVLVGPDSISAGDLEAGWDYLTAKWGTP